MIGKCNKCGNANDDDSVFCKKCGSKISSVSATNSVKRKKFLVLGGSGLLVLVIIGTTLMLQNNPLTKFKHAVEGNQYSDATTVYSQKIKGNSEQEKKAENFIKDELN
ncbi:zinc-ribbon domain-containing protein [Paenibacillus sp.]|uniref:zinc ribbon domain-containing protein n=1 Tax=Paenibacillus sp. TaxID=58172 RepID=UPI0028A6EED5|nr:zinc-ribbon domain-containing protein [Paenibacillus sp.]